jgi:tripartite-type tricarboxylate transporter receptor subunit TctC
LQQLAGNKQRSVQAAGRQENKMMRCSYRWSLAACACVTATLFIGTQYTSHAQGTGPEAFYRGKNVNLIIGYSVGGGYDLYARVLANHLGRHIPGNPTVVPQNMTGAGSAKAALYLYSVAPKDGTVIGTFGRAMATLPLIGDAKFDSTKFTWLGSVTNDVSTCISWHTSAIKTWDDMMKHQFTAGGEGAGAEPDMFAQLYKNVFGAKIKLVTGYPGTADTVLAMERKEVDGLCGLSWSTIKARHAEWLVKKQINILVQAAVKKEPELAHVPMASDLATTQEQQQILKLMIASQAMARPFVAPPDIPADRKAALQAAFDKTMQDPAFLKEAEAKKLDVNPIPGAQIDAMVNELYATPRDVLAKAAKALSNQ